MSDPVLGPVRTMRQHLIVAQTVNGVCQTWPGTPKVAATGDGWLVSGPTGATVAVATVEALWSAVLRSRPQAGPPDLQPAEASGAAEDAGAAAGIGGLEEEVLGSGHSAVGALCPEDLSKRVLNLGHQMARAAHMAH
ncbi:hypothetical protein [Arthrobacter sp. 92]|uniref:hypothetical protein n=1 Tax=Arthrobacter sp. 92 TaxID=3418175 RepID=UPI003CFC6683